MYIPAWTLTCLDTTPSPETCRLQRSPTVCVFAFVSLCWCAGQSVQADGRLDDGRLFQTGFPAPPQCFLSSPFLCSASLHVFVFMHLTLFCGITSCH